MPLVRAVWAVQVDKEEKGLPGRATAVARFLGQRARREDLGLTEFREHRETPA